MNPVNLSYKEVEGIYHPQINLSPEGIYDQMPMGKYGQMAMNYLKEEHVSRYNDLLTEGILLQVMHQVNEEAWNRMEHLQNLMLQREPLENPSDTYQSYRHREMIKAQAEEIVLREIIFIER